MREEKSDKFADWLLSFLEVDSLIIIPNFLWVILTAIGVILAIASIIYFTLIIIITNIILKIKRRFFK